MKDTYSRGDILKWIIADVTGSDNFLAKDWIPGGAIPITSLRGEAARFDDEGKAWSFSDTLNNNQKGDWVKKWTVVPFWEKCVIVPLNATKAVNKDDRRCKATIVARGTMVELCDKYKYVCDRPNVPSIAFIETKTQKFPLILSEETFAEWFEIVE